MSGRDPAGLRGPSPAQTELTDRLRTRALLPLLAAVILLVGGCSNRSIRPAAQADFGTGYTSAIADYRSHFTDLQKQARSVIGKDLDTELSVFAQMAEATHDVLGRLKPLSPPPAIKEIFNQLLTAMSSQETSLHDIQDSARKGDQTGLNNALRSYATALQNGVALQGLVERAVTAKPSNS